MRSRSRRAAPPAAVDPRVVFKLGQWLRYIDDLDGARRHLAQAEQAAREEGDESVAREHPAQPRLLECWAGEWGRPTSSPRAWSMPSSSLAWTPKASTRGGRTSTPTSADSTPCGPRRECASRGADRRDDLGSLSRPRELAAGESEAADRHLAAALAELDRVDFREPAIWRVDGDAIEAAIAVGDLERAESLLARFEERSARSRIPWSLAVSARCRALVLAAGGELEPPPRRWSGRSWSTSAAPFPSSGPARSSSTGRCSAG